MSGGLDGQEAKDGGFPGSVGGCGRGCLRYPGGGDVFIGVHICQSSSGCTL